MLVHEADSVSVAQILRLHIRCELIRANFSFDLCLASSLDCKFKLFGTWTP